ncbi:putative PurR-regulated permease PerM [Thermosporothrix hazakensis]|uniref:AI-2E family transporter n=2 Tax=Thermosporothrix TaxID=768650 RepID=A0A455SI34_9CHLR|nr:AI-2E family transporter [Thermosporothrix hazakensis]PZW29529.1 putative PurR-regulated permease PerM [Thermosporothrix hazakensis]BBH85815.1 AI-2E family transporter [Thermosporothrix sp. COM3]GCE45756.1 AI-2E family transporter [Thermosporothrix hazakensis]
MNRGTETRREQPWNWTRRLVISLTVLVWIVLALVIGWLLQWVIGSLILLAVAVLLAYALYPAVTFLQRYVPRPLAIATVYLVLFMGLCVLLYFLGRTAFQEARSLEQNIERAIIRGDGPIITFLASLNLDWLNISKQQIYDTLLQFGRQLGSQLGTLSQQAAGIVKGVFNVVINTLIVATMSIYLLIDGPRVARWLKTQTPRSQRKNVTFLVETFKRIGGGYIRGQLLLSTILSTLTGLYMAIIGVPYAVFLGVLAFVLSFIPVIGAFITGILCILLALTKGWIIAVLALAFLIAIQVLESNILSPRIVGPAVGLHPVVSLLALLAGGELFGIAGALFASITAGIVQAIIIAAWKTWKESHPDEFTSDGDESEKTQKLAHASEVEAASGS